MLIAIIFKPSPCSNQIFQTAGGKLLKSTIAYKKQGCALIRACALIGMNTVLLEIFLGKQFEIDDVWGAKCKINLSLYFATIVIIRAVFIN